MDQCGLGRHRTGIIPKELGKNHLALGIDLPSRLSIPHAPIKPTLFDKRLRTNQTKVLTWPFKAFQKIPNRKAFLQPFTDQSVALWRAFRGAGPGNPRPAKQPQVHSIAWGGNQKRLNIPLGPNPNILRLGRGSALPK